MIYQLWLHCCRRADNHVTLEEMIAFQPQAEAKLRFYDKYVDKEGKTTLNIEEQMMQRGWTKTGNAQRKYKLLNQGNRKQKKQQAEKTKRNKF